MKLNRKIIIICIIVAILVIIFIISKNSKKQETAVEKNIIYTQTMEDGTLVNTSSRLSETKIIENIEIKNSQLIYRDGTTRLIAEVINIGNEKIDMLEFEAILLDQEGKEIEILDGLLGTIKPGESAELNVAITGDYTNIYDYKLKID